MSGTASLAERRHAAADLCVETSRRLTELGFGCEIIATWEARSGERVAAHVTTANPDRPSADPSPLNRYSDDEAWKAIRSALAISRQGPEPPEERFADALRTFGFTVAPLGLGDDHAA